MAVMRVEKNADYTVMSNYHLDDKRLSLKAIGLLSKILRLPDDWDYSVAGLSHICCEGKAAIASAVRELEEAGYIVRSQLHSASGTFDGFEYVVYECPQTHEPPLTDFPSTDNPSTEKPSTENRAQPNTNIPSTNIPPISPKKRHREPKTAPDWKPERFAAFWEAYPRGESKQAAIAAWDKLRPDDELLAVMGRALKRQMQSEAWQRGIGIPYASTWLNQHRWEDEAKKAPSATDSERRLQVWE